MLVRVGHFRLVGELVLDLVVLRHFLTDDGDVQIHLNVGRLGEGGELTVGHALQRRVEAHDVGYAQQQEKADGEQRGADHGKQLP